jgi:SAM-dependent methyltransferase
VLDLACGQGRNALHFAELGAVVLAVDRDPAALACIDHPHITTLELDLEQVQWPLTEEQYGLWDAIVVTNYLHRPHLDQLPALLNEGGLLLYETFALGNEVFGRPSNPAFLLRRGELLELARRHELQVIAYRDTQVSIPRPAMVQSLCARRVNLHRGQQP